jgi:hypothetical protein
MTIDERQQQGEGYEPPEVEELPTGDGPAVTAAGDSQVSDGRGPEWRPLADEDRPAAQRDER